METTRLRIKKEFAPLTASSHLVVVSNGFSPLLQTYNIRKKEYNPNRQLSPLTIKPNVIAYANDGSLSSPYANANLAADELHWFLDGNPIEDSWTVNVDYEILTVGSDRGSLVVYRNIPTTEQHRLRFEGVIADMRLGQNIEVKTDEVTLRTIDLAEYQYKLNLGCDPVIHYNPFTDPLLLFEHKRSQEIEQDMTEEQAREDKLSYLCRIPIVLFKGDKEAEATDDYTIELYRIGANNTYTLIDTAAEDTEIVEFDRSHIVIDLRMITLENYRVVVKVRGEEKDSIQFAVRRLEPKYDNPVHGNQTGIVPTATARYDRLMMQSNGKVLECPGLSLKIDWFTTSAHATAVQHNEGEETLFTLAKTGIGNTYEDDWLEIYTQIAYKPAYSIASEGDDTIWTDENGTPFIFN